MSDMRTARILNILFLIGLLAAGGFAGSHAYKRHQMLKTARGVEAEAAKNLSLLEAKTEARRTSLARLKHDPEYVEKVVRQKLNYAKENEIVFKFEFDER